MERPSQTRSARIPGDRALAAIAPALLVLGAAACGNETRPELPGSVQAGSGEPVDAQETPPVLRDPGPDRFPAPDAISAFVRRIFEDSKGNLWFGTNGDGVCLYDGRAPGYFSISKGFGGVAVRGIVEDPDRNVWFATEGGVTRFDGDSFRNFTTADGLPHDDCWAILVDRAGTVWVGTYGGACRLVGDRFEPFALPPAAEVDPMRGVSSLTIVRDIMEDRAGHLWFATEDRVCRYDGSALSEITVRDGLCDRSINCVLEGHDGDLWFATHNNGICRFDGTSFVNVNEQEGLSGTEGWDLFEDRDGNLWFTLEHEGVYRYDGTSFEQFDAARGLESPAVQCIYQDRAGRIWAGGYLGLYRLEGERFVAVTRDGPW